MGRFFLYKKQERSSTQETTLITNCAGLPVGWTIISAVYGQGKVDND